MTPERWQQVKDIFDGAVECSPASRRAYVVDRCGDDEELRREVESLLASDAQTRSLLDNPLLETGTSVGEARLHNDVELTGGLLEPGTILRQKYQIVTVLGFGGMAAVYRARNLMLNEDCAVKVLLRQGGRAFLAEAQILRRLKHPHIVRVEDADMADGGRPFVVMEFIAGESLRDRLRGHGPIDCEEALRITADICSGLEAAHAGGIIHRDIKPANLVLAAGADGRTVVKIIDFGIAKVREEAGLGFTGVLRGTTGLFVGTADYASPEQALGRPSNELDGRTDVYSLGLVLYEMLTGVLPFSGETPMARLLQRLNTAPPSPRHLKPELPQSACDVVLRAIELDREARHASALEMRLACENALETIRRDWEGAPQEVVRVPPIAAEVQERNERWRGAAEWLLSPVRKPAALVRRLRAHRAFRRVALVAGGLLLLGIGGFVTAYVHYAKVIDRTLRGGAFVVGSKIYAAPEVVAIGDPETPTEIAASLRRAGYSESRNNPVPTTFIPIQSKSSPAPTPISTRNRESSALPKTTSSASFP